MDIKGASRDLKRIFFYFFVLTILFGELSIGFLGCPTNDLFPLLENLSGNGLLPNLHLRRAG